MKEPTTICIKCKHVNGGETDERHTHECRATVLRQGIDPVTGRMFKTLYACCCEVNNKGYCDLFEEA
jgi:hypothetical protein